MTNNAFGQPIRPDPAIALLLVSQMSPEDTAVTVEAATPTSPYGCVIRRAGKTLQHQETPRPHDRRDPSHAAGVPQRLDGARTASQRDGRARGAAAADHGLTGDAGGRRLAGENAGWASSRDQRQLQGRGRA